MLDLPSGAILPTSVSGPIYDPAQVAKAQTFVATLLGRPVLPTNVWPA